MSWRDEKVVPPAPRLANLYVGRMLLAAVRSLGHFPASERRKASGKSPEICLRHAHESVLFSGIPVTQAGTQRRRALS